MEDWVVLSGSDGGDSVELHDGSDVGGSDTESSFAVVQVRGRAADTGDRRGGRAVATFAFAAGVL
uniref:Uncharacterized protein n=1 Tax=Oryza glaberrima TaxID=4538 RepID=I1PG42_ORYGL